MHNQIPNNEDIPGDGRVEDFSLMELLQLCLDKWVWFVVSFVLVVGMAILYIYSREPVYERTEEILIKDQDSGADIGDISNAFSSLGLVSNNTNVNNELISLTSPAVVREVIRNLHLDINYTRRGSLHRVTLYGTSLPMTVTLPDIGEQEGAEFSIKIESGGDVSLCKFERHSGGKKIKYADVKRIPKGKGSVETPLGKVIVAQNPEYVGNPLEEGYEIKVVRMPMQVAVELYKRKIAADLVDEEADVIGITMKDVSVQRAVDVLDNLLEVYNSNWIDDKNKIAVATSSFIDERLKVIERELGDVDSSIAHYQTSTGTSNLLQTAKLSLEKEQEYDSEVMELQTKLALIESIGDFIKNPANKYSVLPMNVGIESPVIEEQTAAYNKLVLERKTLLDNSSEKNPFVSDLSARLDGMRTSIMHSVEKHKRDLSAMLKTARGELGKARDKMLSTPSKGLPLLSEERQRKVMESLYLFLLQKREENELSQAFIAYNTRVITPPMGPLLPVSPRKSLILIVAVILSLALPIVALYIVKTGDTKVRTRRDLESVKAPFAGEIPQVGKRKRLPKQSVPRKKKEISPIVVVEEGSRNVVNEALRVVRSNIEFMCGRKESGHVIMITSFNPGSGKSFVSYNLALSFALKKKRVLVLDCDMRHGSASMFVGSPGIGLSDYLSGKSEDYRSLVVKANQSPMVDVFPVGKIPPNPAELLDTQRFAELVATMRECYDYVFIDTPPVDIVVDTQIVGRHVDNTLFVLRASLIERKTLAELNRYYENKRFPNISVLLNGTEASRSRYYYYGES